MPSSFQEGVRSVLQKAKRNRRLSQDVNFSESSSKSTPESSGSWPSPKLKEYMHVSGLVNVLGGCFLPSKKKHQDGEIDSRQVFVNPSNNSGALQLVGSFRLNAAQDKSNLVIFTMSELIKATSNFSPSLKIGQGGFGTVYKGKLKDGSFVAIKRAKKNLCDGQLSAEFRNELSTLSDIEHLNLVKLIGYAEEGPERVLVVEYIANGNLREHLDGQYGAILD
eukprot:c23418_g3_i1 orf=346-1011(+)